MVQALSNAAVAAAPLAGEVGFVRRALGCALVGGALGLALQTLLLANSRPTGLWYVLTALLPLHIGAAGGVLVELLRATPASAWPARCALGRPSAAGGLRVLLTALWLGTLVGLVHWVAVNLGRLWGLETAPSALPQALAGGGVGTVVALTLLLLLWVPLLEEVLFRFLLTDALSAAGVASAGVWSAALFALAHGVPAHIPGLLLLGLALQHLRRRHRGLWAPILAHALYNAAALSWILLAGV